MGKIIRGKGVRLFIDDKEVNIHLPPDYKHRKSPFEYAGQLAKRMTRRFSLNRSKP